MSYLPSGLSLCSPLHLAWLPFWLGHLTHHPWSHSNVIVLGMSSLSPYVTPTAENTRDFVESFKIPKAVIQSVLSNCSLNTWVKAKKEKNWGDSSCESLNATILFVTCITASILYLVMALGDMPHVLLWKLTSISISHHIFCFYLCFFLDRRWLGLWERKSSLSPAMDLWECGHVLEECWPVLPLMSTSPGTALYIPWQLLCFSYTARAMFTIQGAVEKSLYPRVHWAQVKHAKGQPVTAPGAKFWLIWSVIKPNYFLIPHLWWLWGTVVALDGSTGQILFFLDSPGVQTTKEMKRDRAYTSAWLFI